MVETAIRQGDESIATGLHMDRQDSGRGLALNDVGGEQPSNRRITADSFRLLSARLNKTPIIPAFAPALEPEKIAAQPAAVAHEFIPETVALPPIELPAEVAHPFFPDLPAFIEEPVEIDAEPEIEQVAKAAAETITVEEPIETEDRAFPVFDEVQEPQADEPQALVAEPQIEVPPTPAFEDVVLEVEPAPIVEAVDEASSEVEVEVEVEPEPVIEQVQEPIMDLAVEPTAEVADEPIETAVAEPIIEVEALSPEVTQLDRLPTTRIEVEGITEIAKSIYQKPSAADRAAFLAEVAEIAAAEAAEEHAKSEILAVTSTEVSEPAKPQLRRAKPVDDPFQKITLDKTHDDVISIATDEDAGELARSLLDMMLSNPSAGLPQERALAADALLKLVPRIPLKSLMAIVERVSVMEAPPHLLVTKLINDPRIEVAGPLLENCNHINDQVLGKVVETGQVNLQRLIARRRNISTAISDQLIGFDDPSVMLTLVRNTGVAFSHQAFLRLTDHARRHPAMLAPLATRADLPAPTAFELFWSVPAELRRYLLSRFLTDSETLTKILKITNAMQVGEQGSEVKFPEYEQIEALVSLLKSGDIPEASVMLAEIASIQVETASRIISDRDGEPLAVAFKAMAANRARFEEIIGILKTSDFGIIKNERSTAELHNVFDSMSFNKARVLLTYWDWAMLRSGPYAPSN